LINQKNVLKNEESDDYIIAYIILLSAHVKTALFILKTLKKSSFCFKSALKEPSKKGY
jgi:hypothetical protein